MPEDTDTAAGAVEQKRFYTFDATGSILITSTNPDPTSINQSVKDLLSKVEVLFVGITKALSTKGKNLFDYDAVSQVLEGSGFLIEEGRRETRYTHEEVNVSVSTAIVKALLSGYGQPGLALRSILNVVGNMGNELNARMSTSSKSDRLCHLLFIAEGLLGVPVATITLYSVNIQEAQQIAKTNCASASHEKMAFSYQEETYIFVDPATVDKFSSEFQHSEEFDKLVEELAKSIKDKSDKK